MNILFACKYNRFRSKLAEAFFNKYNTNKKHKAKSVGLVKGRPVGQNTKRIAKEHKLKIVGQPRTLDYKDIPWVDMVVIVAKDVPSSVFRFDGYKKFPKIIRWEIPDGWEIGEDKVDKISSMIEKKVKAFVKNLK